MQYVRKSAYAGTGVVLGAYGVLKMDDMVYTQLKKNVVIPFQVLTNSQNIGSKDLMEIGTGATTFVR
jgi:hypothetical protein